MSIRTYRARLIDPQGNELDVTDRTDIGDFGAIANSPESDLSILTHNEVDFTLANDDGAVEEFLAGAGPNDVYQFIFERQNPDGSDWDRLFGGILDLPSSVQYDDMTRDAQITSFSFSKLLDRVDGTVIERTITAKTATVSDGSKSITIVTGGSTDIKVGDVITLDDGAGNTQDFTIDSVGSGVVVATETATQAYTAAAATVTTPYYRDLTPAALLAILAGAAGLDYEDLVTGRPMAPYPVTTPMPIDGLNLSGVARGLTVKSGAIDVQFGSLAAFQEAHSAGPTSPWVLSGAPADPLADWTPYGNTEPTARTLVATAVDNGREAWDHAGNARYDITEIVTGTGPYTHTLWLRKNATSYVTLDSLSAADNGPKWRFTQLDFDKANGRVWYSFARSDNSSKQFGYVDLTGGTKTAVDSSTVAAIRTVSQAGVLLLWTEDYATLKVYSLTSFGFLASIPLDKGMGQAGHWTARAVGSAIAWICRGPDGNGSWLAVLDAQTWTIRVRIPVAVANSAVFGGVTSTGAPFVTTGTPALLTRFPVGARDVLVGWAAGEWFVVSTCYDGVIRYADFSDKSGTECLKGLALACAGVATVDNFRTAVITPRQSMGAGASVATFSGFFASVRLPISSQYRASVKVTATDDQGNSIEAVAGDPADSARRLEIAADFVSSLGQAYSLAAATAAFLSMVGEELQITVDDDGTPVDALDRVTVGEKDYCVYSSQIDLDAEQLELVLLEVA